MKYKEIFDKPKVIAVIGNVNEAKSNLLYHIITDLRTSGDFELYTYGMRMEIKNSKKIHSVNELERIKNSIIILDEVMSLWDLDNRMAKRQIESTLRLINHNNNILVISALPENMKKFICGKIDQYLFKKCTLSDFIQGSRASRIVKNYKGIELGTSLLSIEKGEVLLFDGLHYNKLEVPYLKEFDSKKDNVEIVKKIVKKTVKKTVKKQFRNIVKKNKCKQSVTYYD